MKLINQLSDLLRELRARFELWRKPKKDCYHCCLFCDYFEDCKADIYAGKTVEHRGYTIHQSGINYHTAIYDDSGRYVFHAQVCKPLTIEELKEQIDFYIKLRSDNFEKSLDEEAQNEN